MKVLRCFSCGRFIEQSKFISSAACRRCNQKMLPCEYTKRELSKKPGWKVINMEESIKDKLEI